MKDKELLKSLKELNLPCVVVSSLGDFIALDWSKEEFIKDGYLFFRSGNLDLNKILTICKIEVFSKEERDKIRKDLRLNRFKVIEGDKNE